MKVVARYVMVFAVFVALGVAVAPPEFKSQSVGSGGTPMVVTCSRLNFAVGGPGDTTAPAYLIPTGPGHLYLNVRDAPGIVIGGENFISFTAYRLAPGLFEIDLADGQGLYGQLENNSSPLIHMDLLLVEHAP